MQISQDQYPLYEKASKKSRVPVCILKHPGETFQNDDATLTVSEGYYLIGVEEEGVGSFWKKLEELQC